MKIIYSEIKKWLPNLNVDPKILRDDLTLIGHFVSGFEEIDGETVLDLEIRQNRGDCLGYYGVARDLSTYYQLDIKIPEIVAFNFTNSSVPVEIKSSDVKRIQSVKLTDLKNTSSPEWLVKFLKLHDINSINTLVDLTNYIMIWWGIPCHAFDAQKSSKLIWENNTSQKYSEFTTLDGTVLKLAPENLLITNDQKVLSLSFIGGQNSGIELSTSATILEMAVYNRSRIRSDSRSLKAITEASIRLDKYLDTELISIAFNHLISLVQQFCNTKIDSELLDIYSQKPEKVNIEFDPNKPSLYAGINIPSDYSIKCLEKLGCQINNNIVNPPTNRSDLNLEEDLIEEVIRFWGYQKIPINIPINSEKLEDITPKVLYLIEELKDKLTKLGYDEVRSWPLVQKNLNDQAIFTQNSINSDYPVLRQSIIQSLIQQLDQYSRYKLPNPQFFEIGKIFSKTGDQFIEKNSLAIYNYNSDQLLKDLQQLKLETKIIDNNFAQIILDDLNKPENYIPQNPHNNAYELTSQIITLDANLTLDTKEDPIKLIEKYSKIIGSEFLWKLIITDIYQDSKTNKYKYTFQASYFNLDDKKAKKLHLTSFNLL